MKFRNALGIVAVFTLYIFEFTSNSVSAAPSSSSATPFNNSAAAFSSSSYTATPCSSVSVGNTAVCYSQRSSCHYNMQYNQCISAAPQSCIEYLSDSTGCQSNSTCTYLSTASLCITKPSLCTAVTGATACSLRSDCRWSYGTCINNTTACSASTNQIQCSANSCFWDIYLSSCFNTLAEVASNNPCSTWTALSSQACVYHGCMIDAATLVCSASSTSSVVGNSIAVSNSVRYSNSQVLPGTTKFQVTVSYSYVLSNAPPIWTFVTIGSVGSGASSLYGNPIPSPSACNNVAPASLLAMPSFTVPGLNMTLEQQLFNTWISSNSNMNFSQALKTDPNYLAITNLAALVGSVNVDPSGLSSIATSVSINSATSSIDMTITMDLTTLTAQCAGLGAYQTQTLTGTYYTIPILTNQYAAQSTSSAVFPLVISTPSVFSVYVPSTGSIAIATANGFSTNAYLIEVDQTTMNCPYGQASLLLSYELIVSNVFTAASMYVGPMSASDIQFSTSQAPGVIFNCYGDSVVSFTSGTSVASLSISKSTFVVSTLCRQLQPTLDTFMNCSYANYGDRVAAMGGNNPFPAIDGQHTFFVKLWQAPLSGSAPTTDSSRWTTVGASGLPIKIPVTVNVKSSASPDVAMSVQLQVYAGLLSNVTDTQLADIQIFSYTNASGLIAQPVISPNYTSTVSSIEAFTFVIGMATPQLQALSTLLITLDGSFAFTPLDRSGRAVGSVLHWNDVFTLMTFVPKQSLNLNFCSTSKCALLPVSSNNGGFDGFSIPVATLMSLAPGAAGFSFNTDCAFTLTGQASQNSLHSVQFSLAASGSQHSSHSHTQSGKHDRTHTRMQAVNTEASTYTGQIMGAFIIRDAVLATGNTTNTTSASTAATGNTTTTTSWSDSFFTPTVTVVFICGGVALALLTLAAVVVYVSKAKQLATTTDQVDSAQTEDEEEL